MPDPLIPYNILINNLYYPDDINYYFIITDQIIKE